MRSGPTDDGSRGRGREALRKALSMATTRAYVVDDAVMARRGRDVAGAAEALKKLEWDVVITGMASTDGTMKGVVPAMLAKRLGVPGLTLAGNLAVEGSTVTIRRDGDDASTTITAELPRWCRSPTRPVRPATRRSRGSLAAKKNP